MKSATNTTSEPSVDARSFLLLSCVLSLAMILYHWEIAAAPGLLHLPGDRTIRKGLLKSLIISTSGLSVTL